MAENMKLASSIIYRQIASLFFILLLLPALVSFFMGEKVDAIIIIITIMVINVLLGFFSRIQGIKGVRKITSFGANKNICISC